MNTQNLPPMGFDGLEEWTARSGIGGGMVTQEGLYPVTIESIEAEWSGNERTPPDQRKAQLKVVAKITAEGGEQAGKSLFSRVIYWGKDSKGKNMNYQFAQFLCSIGYTQEQINAFAKNKQQIDPTQLQQYVGLPGFVQVSFDVYEGQLRTQVDNWILASAYAAEAQQEGSKVFRGRRAEEVDVAKIMAAKSANRADARSQFAGSAPAMAPGLGAGAPSLNIGGPQAAPGIAQPPAPGAVAPAAAPAMPNNNAGVQAPGVPQVPSIPRPSF